MKGSSKRLMKTGIAVVLTASMLAACGSNSDPKPGAGGNTDSAKPFQGKKLSVVTANHPWGDAIKDKIPQFEEMTGMKVDVQSYFEDQLTQKLTVQFTSRSTTPDVFMYRPLQEAKQFYHNGWIQPLDEYVNKDASYDFEDFSKASVSTNTVDGKLVGIPIITEQHILYYRKDLLEQKNIPVPKTMDELMAAAAALHDPQNEVYGFVSRGQLAALVSQISSFIYSEGGEFLRDGKAILNSPESLKGMDIYATLLREYGPPGVLNMSWPQAIGVFAQGKAAFFADANSIYHNATDPEKSVIADKIGYAQFPAGSAGSLPFNIASWGVAMNSESSNKDAAWAFIQWQRAKK